jgi:hypothetical protein
MLSKAIKVGKDTKPNKYKAKKCEFNGIKFDSKVEMAYYLHLLTKYQPSDIKIHPKFILQGSRNLGKNHPDNLKPVTYSGDFSIDMTVFDVKASRTMVTEATKLRIKLFKYRYPDYRLIIVFRVKGEWVEL